jgi:hypothetical protein
MAESKLRAVIETRSPEQLRGPGCLDWMRVAGKVHNWVGRVNEIRHQTSGQFRDFPEYAEQKLGVPAVQR